MPLHPHKREIVEFSELYQFCKEFSMSPTQVREWRENNPHEYKCFRAFLAGMSKSAKSSELDAPKMQAPPRGKR